MSQLKPDDWDRVLHALDIGVVIQDRDSRILFANPKATSLLGITADEMRQRTTDDVRWDVVSADGAPVADDGHPGVLAARTGQPVRGVILGVRRHDLDERVWISVSAIPEYDEHGNVQWVAITFTDVNVAQRALREQEALYQSVFRSMSEGVVVHNVDGSIRSANASAERTLGLSVEQMSGRAAVDPRWQLVKTDYSPVGPEDIPSEITKQTAEAAPERILGVRRPTGELAWLNVRAVPLRAPGDGQMSGIVATFADVTNERETTLALEASRAQVQRVLDAVPGVVYQYLRPDEGVDHFPFIAGSIQAVLGLDPAAAVADPRLIFSLASEADQAALREHIDVTIRARANFDYDIAITTPAGQSRWLKVHGVPDRSAEGILYTGVIYEVTEEHRLTDALRRTQRREAMGAMAAGIAHNFNNMLAVILPNIELLRAEVSPSSRALLDDAEHAARSAADLVRRMLALGRIDAPDADSAVDLVLLLTESLHLCRQTFDRVIVTNERVEPRHAHVRASASALQQVVINFLLNARDAVATRAQPVIDVTLMREGDDAVRLTIRDNGHGMDEATLRRVGEPFFTTKDVGKGTGLGLASAFHTIAEAGGSWSVDSAVGVGTTFSVRLPLAPEPVGRDAVASSEPTAALRGRVLVVDDEPMVRRVLGRQLEQLGFETVLTGDGDEALQLLAHDGLRGLKAILLDLSMPGLPGAQLLPLLRGRAPQIPIVVLSGHVPDASLLDQAAAILQKPVSQAELRDALRAVVGEP
jgi:PAS domain S-box-containing protein